MTIIFRIQYHTNWGENLRVLIDEKTTVELTTVDGYCWQGQTDYLPDTPVPLVTYRYEVWQDNCRIRREWGILPHILYITDTQERHYLVQDTWRDLPAASYRFSSAFCGENVSQRIETLPTPGNDTAIVIRALCPSNGKSTRILGITGNCKTLGNWGETAPLRMHEVKPNEWQVAIDATILPPDFTYKYVTLSPEDGSITEWEAHENRNITPPSLQPGETYVTPEEEVFFASESYKIAGCAIPVFSLRSEGSYGVGDFGDLKSFIRWAAHTHQRAVQVLPINDTTMTGTWTDSYPYSSISIYAFHPMYVDLRQLPALNDQASAITFEQKRNELNALPQVDYEVVNQWKRAYLKAIFQQEQDTVLNSNGSANSIVRTPNGYARMQHSVTCATSSRHLTSTNGKITALTIRKQPNNCAHLTTKPYPETMFHCYVQYLLHVQLLDACNYGRKLGVIVKGDIPHRYQPYQCRSMGRTLLFQHERTGRCTARCVFYQRTKLGHANL